MNIKTAVHIIDKYLLNPTNPVIVNLIGAGGTGSHMLTELYKINHALIALGHAGLMVNLFDDDVITEANLGRQGFAASEVGLHKSVALINRVNRFAGTNWKAVRQKFGYEHREAIPHGGLANIYISCVDTVAARYDIEKVLDNLSYHSSDRNRPFYWMDLGNSRYTGQVVLSTVHSIKQPASEKYDTVAELPRITAEFAELLNAEADNNEPSCSLAEALQFQDLFINPAVSLNGGILLWRIFSEGMVDTRGVFINLRTFRTEPIKIRA